MCSLQKTYALWHNQDFGYMVQHCDVTSMNSLPRIHDDGSNNCYYYSFTSVYLVTMWDALYGTVYPYDDILIFIMYCFTVHLATMTKTFSDFLWLHYQVS